MNMKARKPLPKAQVKVDLKEAETIKCSKCSNYLFITSFVLKRLSAILSPTGQEALIPVQVYSCGNCGAVAEGFLEGSGIEEEKPKEDSLFRSDL
jgi:uncharacterized Zn finger protein